MINDPSSNHRLAWDLIPWIVNGTAGEPERKLAEAHIRGCADCREELESQRQLQQRIATAPSCELETRDSWQLLRARLNTLVPVRTTPANSNPQRVRHRAAWAGWLAAAVIAQAIGLGALALALAARSPVSAPAAQGAGAPVASSLRGGTSAAEAAAYRTLASSQALAPAGTIRAVFAPQTTVLELQAILARAHLRIISGPRAGGVWWLVPSPGAGEADGAVRALRASPLVRFAASEDGAP